MVVGGAAGGSVVGKRQPRSNLFSLNPDCRRNLSTDTGSEDATKLNLTVVVVRYADSKIKQSFDVGG